MKLACSTVSVCLNYSTSFRDDYFSSFKNNTKDWHTVAKLASRLTCLDGEPQPRAGEKNGARKSEPARELLNSLRSLTNAAIRLV